MLEKGGERMTEGACRQVQFLFHFIMVVEPQKDRLICDWGQMLTKRHL